MAEQLKTKYYNADSLRDLALRIQAVYPPFQAGDFVSDIMDESWDELALKARTRQVALVLGARLPSDYEQALDVLFRMLADYPEGWSDFALLCLPDFVEVFGQDVRHWDASMNALERFTPFASSEFAVRPFIIRDEERMMRQMAAWARHDNEHVRRLASEGCRPQLPWGQVLVSFKNDPTPVFDILEQLKADPSPYVRKSVANNLNDISKTHPDLVIQIAHDWYGTNERTDWILKHGCRTLLKKGNREVLALFGLADADSVNVEGFVLRSASVPIGGALTFSFKIEATKPMKVRLEYAIDYVKANGIRSRKLFKISEISLQASQAKTYEKTHSFADCSTRKHYPGIHTITLIVNGAEKAMQHFEVLTVR